MNFIPVTVICESNLDQQSVVVCGHISHRGHRGHDQVVVGFTTTYAINAYQNWSCEFKSHSDEVYSIQHYVKFVSDMVLSAHSNFLHLWNWPPRYNWNIIESGIKHHIPPSPPTYQLVVMCGHISCWIQGWLNLLWCI